MSSYELITIPMFLLMAEMVLVSGVADDLFRAAAAWVGRVPGGLGMATALAGAGFGAICGSSTASAATLVLDQPAGDDPAGLRAEDGGGRGRDLRHAVDAAADQRGAW